MNTAHIPQKLEVLNKIAHNLWWSWNQESWDLFSKLNPEHWESCRNPVTTLQNTTAERYKEMEADSEFVSQVEAIGKKLDSYLNEENTWFNKNHSNKKDELVAYFCTEYGIHESLPIYSGGLGVLAGDHIKSSSDLGIPMIFIGLLYRNGYFTQQIDKEGKQVDVYGQFNPEELPVEAVLDQNGSPLKISVSLTDREVNAFVWKAKVGRNDLYLLDSDVEGNSEQDRHLTARLYGGDRTMRIEQEILLGIGGNRAIEAMGLTPSMYHMNEGHSGFFQLERIKDLMNKNGLNFEQAKTTVSANCLFTTHTPVPAGNETFNLPLVHKYLHDYVAELGIDWSQFLDLGLVEESSDHKYFSLTVFAINLSKFHNGVSELHGKIASKMWRDCWPNVPEADNPMTYVTNGVHVQTWVSKEMKDMYSEFWGDSWEDELTAYEYWEDPKNWNYDVLRSTKQGLKCKMIKMVRKQLKQQLERNGESQEQIDEVENFLKDDVLTIGFARRFATYKRATLIFNDLNKLASIVNNSEKPVQFVFAGKAHPADKPGQKFIEEIYKFSRRPELKGKVIILENYDMNISRHMVAGVDVWLNNPRRPMEASGTSGMKVPLNGGINFSVLDGWWREAYNSENGWTIGFEKDYPNNETQDQDDAENFYQTLSQTIVPLYYDSPENWLGKVRSSLTTNISRFSTHRMLKEYAEKLYIPAIENGKVFTSAKQDVIDTYNIMNTELHQRWQEVTFQAVQWEGHVKQGDSKFEEVYPTPSHHVEFKIDETLPGNVYETTEADVAMEVYLGEINPANVNVEMVVTENDSDKVFTYDLKNEKELGDGLYLFKTHFQSPDGTNKRLRFRVFPVIANTCSKFELGLSTWL